MRRDTSDWRSVYRRCLGKGLWICLSSAGAMAAQDWCLQQGVAVPGAAAIVSLEADPALIGRGISAAAPDSDTIGYQLAHSLMGDIPLARTRHGYLDTRAMVYQRLTTA